MGRNNRLLIRLQSSGKRNEVNDTLTFDIVSTYEVARCVRGHTVNGKPDYDERFCWWGADGKGPPYVRIGLDEPIRANLAPRRTCPPPPDVGEHVPSQQGAFVVGTAYAGENLSAGVARPPESGPDVSPPLPMTMTMTTMMPAGTPATTKPPPRWPSWIIFQSFGGAAENDKPPEARDVVPEDFKVDFDERVTASFHIELTDDRVLKAVRMMSPESEADILGVLDGKVNFELARGQGAQAFP